MSLQTVTKFKPLLQITNNAMVFKYGEDQPQSNFLTGSLMTLHNRCLAMKNPLLFCNLHDTDHNVLKWSTAKKTHADPDGLRLQH